MDATRPVALVTGAARRIGAAIARRLHADGYAIALHWHRAAAAADALVSELEAACPGSAVALQADLADADAPAALVAATLDHFGRLDALVNNAAAFAPTALAATTADDWDTLFATNARAPFLLAQAAAPALRASRGAIVNIADVYAERPRADLVAYAASKAALVGLTRGLAVALAPEVRVNAVAPGAILWPEADADAAPKDAILAATPLARLGDAGDVAGAVAWLLRGAGFSTGEVLRVDGGRAL